MFEELHCVGSSTYWFLSFVLEFKLARFSAFQIKEVLINFLWLNVSSLLALEALVGLDMQIHA